MTSHNYTARSLQQTVLLRIAPVAVLFVFTLLALTSFRVTNVVRQEIQYGVNESAMQAANGTEAKLQPVLDACRSVASNDVVVNGIVDVEFREAVTQAFFRSQVMPGTVEQTFTMTDHRGRVIAGSKRTVDYENATWLSTVMSGHEVVVIEDQHLIVAVPVYIAIRPEAMVVTAYSLKEFLSDITVNDYGHVVSYQHTGEVVASSNGNVITEGASLTPPPGWLIGISKVAQLPNVEVAVLKSEEVAMTAARTVRQSLLVATAFAAVVGFLGLWLTCKLVEKPVTSLLGQIERVQETGNLNTRVTPAGTREFVELANRLNDMLSQLQDTTVSASVFERERQQLDLAVRGGNVGLWDWNATTDEVYYSAELKTQLGYSPDAEWTTFDDWKSRVHPDDIAEALQSVDDYLCHRSQVYEITTRMRCEDGSYRWIQSSGAAEFDDTGKATRMVGVHFDVQSRIEHAKVLEERRHELESIASAVPMTLYVYDVVEQKYVFTNRKICATLGYAFANDSQEFLESLIHVDDRKSVAEHFARIATADTEDGPHGHEVEYRVLYADRTYRTLYRNDAVLHRCPEGSVQQIVGTLTEIDDLELLKRTAVDLKKANEELAQFAYVASHDLQEPLRKVSAFCSLLDQEYGGVLKGDGKTYLHYVIDGASRMQTLIRDLLDFSRVESQGSELSQACMGETLNNAIANLTAAIEDSGAKITHDKLPRVYVDSRQLTQLLQNLLGNSIKYCVDPPKIHIGVEERDSQYLISVEDNGIGISPEYFDRIFGIFKRLHSREEYPGTGIGLAICKRIVERWGQRIWVESEKGIGSTFYFSVAKANMKQSSVAFPPAANAAVSKPVSV